MTRSSRSRFRGASLHVAPLVAALSTCFVLSLAGTVHAGARPQPAADPHPTLPQGQGRDVMIRVCSVCHDPELAADQRFDKAGWKDLVDQMASKGANATEAEFTQIVDYLSAAFPPEK